MIYVHWCKKSDYHWQIQGGARDACSPLGPNVIYFLGVGGPHVCEILDLPLSNFAYKVMVHNYQN